jgi:hypothetical protein
MDYRGGTLLELPMKKQQQRSWACFCFSWAAATTLLNHCGISQIYVASISHGDHQTKIRGGNKTR